MYRRFLVGLLGAVYGSVARTRFVQMMLLNKQANSTTKIRAKYPIQKQPISLERIIRRKEGKMGRGEGSGEKRREWGLVPYVIGTWAELG